MKVKAVENGSLKVQVFLYYATVLKNKKSERVFPEFEQDTTEYNRIASERLKARYYEEDNRLWSLEEYMKMFGWAAKSQARELAEDRALEIREELIAEGFLWKKIIEKPWGRSGKGKRITTYIGLTSKGREWAPKYIEKFGLAKIEDK